MKKTTLSLLAVLAWSLPQAGAAYITQKWGMYGLQFVSTFPQPQRDNIKLGEIAVTYDDQAAGTISLTNGLKDLSFAYYRPPFAQIPVAQSFVTDGQYVGGGNLAFSMIPATLEMAISHTANSGYYLSWHGISRIEVQYLMPVTGAYFQLNQVIYKPVGVPDTGNTAILLLSALSGISLLGWKSRKHR